MRGRQPGDGAKPAIEQGLRRRVHRAVGVRKSDGRERRGEREGAKKIPGESRRDETFCNVCTVIDSQSDSPISQKSFCYIQRTCISACRGGNRCTSCRCVSACRGGRGCTPRSCVSAYRGSSQCTPRSRVSACREGRGCTPRTCFSACRVRIASVPSHVRFSQKLPHAATSSFATPRPLRRPLVNFVSDTLELFLTAS